ncbi:MAG: tetrahydromethanopterin S-methyltransferase subunit H [Candidatus Freyarchaeota archaeon]|nr:tetrahydromethanopterin S-methyltransferase subunit H [Candidatus Jordarchaeia archaeon]
MFKFGVEQKTFTIGGVKVGGQPGQFPTVMMGTIFYHGDKLVEDERVGLFDRAAAEKVLDREGEISLKTGNPRIVDVCASYPQAFEKFIDFVADATEGPFCIDGTTADVRIAGAKYVMETGLSSRVVYNSISPEVREDELQAIRDAGIKSAIILLLNTRNPLISGKFEVIDGLLGKVSAAGVENILVDAAIFDILDPGPVSKAIYLVKERYGYPAGCGAHNAVDIWNKRRKLSPSIRFSSTITANILPVVMGADFMLYGPIENAAKIYPVIALADAYVAYTMWQEHGVRPSTNNHPFYNLHKIADIS